MNYRYAKDQAVFLNKTNINIENLNTMALNPTERYLDSFKINKFRTKADFETALAQQLIGNDELSIIVGEETLALADGKTFFNHKESQDDSLAEWKDTTKRRVQSAYYNFMTEANLLRSEGQKNYIMMVL